MPLFDTEGSRHRTSFSRRAGPRSAAMAATVGLADEEDLADRLPAGCHPGTLYSAMHCPVDYHLAKAL
eukprot:scaffold7395_cov417-Prasinococcus_capsulatus_cf.AAC.2